MAVSSLLHCNGTNGSTTLTDATGKTWTLGGTSNASIDTSTKKFGSASLHIDQFQSDPGPSYSTPAHADFDFGTGDWCFEGFINWVDGGNLDGVLFDYSNAASGGIAARVADYSGGFVRFNVYGPAYAGLLQIDLATGHIRDGGVFGYVKIARSAGMTWIQHESTVGTPVADTNNYAALAGTGAVMQLGTLASPHATDEGNYWKYAGNYDELRWLKGETVTGSTIPTAEFPDPTTGVTVALTGNAGTSAIASLAPSRDKALTNNVGTGAVGTLTKDRSAPLTGNAGTGQVDSVTVAGSPDVTAALTGMDGTTALGNLVESNDEPLAGIAAAGAVGNVVASTDATAALTGVEATSAVGTLVTDASAAIAGAQADTAQGTLTPANTEPLDSTGADATGSAGNVSAGSDVVASLTSVTGTAAQGDEVPVNDEPLAGIAAAGAVGGLVESNDEPLDGVAGITALGVLTASASSGDITLALTGAAATGVAGSLAPGVDRVLTGVECNAALGVLTYGASFALTGVEGAGQAGSTNTNLDPTLWMHWVVPGERRTYTIPGERRAFAIPGERRTWKMTR